ncbi:MAG: class I SAM-dependent methyltransferase [Verrucomicrobiales bacterium]
MAETFYVPGAKRAERVQDLFGAIANRYDLINDLQSFGLHRSWKNKVIELAQPTLKDRVLDVCCGTGDLALRFAPFAKEVIGYDFSEPMLQVARKRSAALIPSPPGRGKGEGIPSSQNLNTTFIQGDALHLPFPGQAFDIVTIGYGLRNLADFNGGLNELWRVLKPGGRLLILDFGKPDNALWRWGYFQYLRWLVPVFGKVLCGNAATHAYILQSLLHYPAQKGVALQLSKMGCKHSEVINLLGGVMSINLAIKA